MSESKPITGEQLFDPSLWSTEKLNAYIASLKEAKDGLIGIQKAQLTVVKGTGMSNATDINAQEAAIKNLNAANIANVKIQQEQLKAQALLEKVKQQEIVTQQKLNQETTRQNKLFDTQNSQYKAATQQLSLLKNQLKELEITGRTNGKLYKALGDEFTTLNTKVRSAEQSVGEFQRNVGNYPQQLRSIQKELAGLEPGTEQFNKLAKKAGELKNRIVDAKEATKAFASESKATQGVTLFKQMGSDLADLNFKEAGEKAKMLSSVLKSITFTEILEGAKNLGGVFVELGKTLLTNPIFVAAAAIAAISYAFYDAYSAAKDFNSLSEVTNKSLKESAERAKELGDRQSEAIIKIGIARGLYTKELGEQKITEIKNSRERIKLREDLNNNILELAKTSGLELTDLEKTNQKAEELYSINFNHKEQLRREKFNNEVKILKEQAFKDDVKLRTAQILDLKVVEAVSAADSDKKAKKKEDELAKANKEAADKETERLKAKYKNQEYITNTHIKDEKDAQVKANIKDEKDAQVKANIELEKSHLLVTNDDDEAKKRKERQARFKEELDSETQLVGDAIKEQNQLKNAQLEYQINTENQAVEEQQQLANRGLKNNLAAEIAMRAKSQLALEKQKEKEVKEAKELAFLKTFTAFIESDPEHPATAISKTIVETTLASLIAHGFAAKDGVEMIKGVGTETSDSNLYALSKGESVLTAAGTKRNIGLATAINAGEEDKWFANKWLPKFAMSVDNNTGSFSESIATSALLNGISQTNSRLENLEKIISSKQEVNVHWDSFGNLIERIKKDNVVTTINHISSKPRL